MIKNRKKQEVKRKGKDNLDMNKLLRKVNKQQEIMLHLKCNGVNYKKLMNVKN